MSVHWHSMNHVGFGASLRPMAKTTRLSRTYNTNGETLRISVYAQPDATGCRDEVGGSSSGRMARSPPRLPSSPRTPNEATAELDDRMPVIMEKQRWPTWLGKV